MDIIAHSLWSILILGNYGNIIPLIFFGIFADLFSWTIFGGLPKKYKNGFTWKNPDLNLIPDWMHTLYGATHSIFVFSISFIIVWLLIGKAPIIMLAWLIHILMDIPTHSRSFLPTPFLWPISNWKFPGWQWTDWRFMILNYLAIGLVFILTH